MFAGCCNGSLFYFYYFFVSISTLLGVTISSAALPLKGLNANKFYQSIS